MTTSTSMTDGHTARRTLAYRYHNLEPGPYDYSPARDQWRVEQALARALDRHDTVEAAVAEVNRENGWDLNLGSVVLLILIAERIDAHGDDHYADVDRYCDVLRDLARLGTRPVYVGRHRDGRTAPTSDHTGTHRAHVAVA